MCQNLSFFYITHYFLCTTSPRGEKSKYKDIPKIHNNIDHQEHLGSSGREEIPGFAFGCRAEERLLQNFMLQNIFVSLKKLIKMFMA